MSIPSWRPGKSEREEGIPSVTKLTVKGRAGGWSREMAVLTVTRRDREPDREQDG
jgi:hypothetical protein